MLRTVGGNLIIFVIRAFKNNSDANRTVNSFVIDTRLGKRALIETAVMANDIMHTQRLHAKICEESNHGWYGILYDNEHISMGLSYSLLHHIKGKWDVLQAIKKEQDGGTIQAPRFFRRNVQLVEESLMPSKLLDLKYSTVMDGWILPHV